MNPVRKSVVLISVAVAFQGVSHSFGQPNDGDFRSKATGDWFSSSTWEVYSAKNNTWSASSSGPNSLTSFVTIRPDHVVTLFGTTSVGTLVIEDDTSCCGGELKIQGSGCGNPECSFACNVPPGQLTIHTALHMKATPGSDPARIEFTSCGNYNVSVGKLEADANITIGGEVSVVQLGGGAITALDSNVITIAPTAVIDAPSGPLTLSGAFEVEGTVRANGPHTITVSGTGPRLGSCGNWEITHDSGKIRFDTSAPVTVDCPQGYFLLQAGTLDIQRSLTFGGGLKQTGGVVNVAAFQTLTVTGRYVGP